jgi:4'-phosphopantetheinyl transferase EntD
MTHCAGYRAAAVARAGEVASIGIDAERSGPLPDGVRGLIARDEEVARLAELASADPRLPWDMVLFSAKESVYKAWFPLTLRWLDFAEASVTIDAGLSTFAARLLVPGPVVAGRTISAFDGRWLVHGEFVLTAIVVKASAENMAA